jgi:hypothetical protein
MLGLERETGLSGYDSLEESVAEDVDILLKGYGDVDDVDDDAYY